jgi:segregation and condensation protein B
MRSVKAARSELDAQHATHARFNRRASGQGSDLFDADLIDLPQAMRWREWMGRVEAAIFASPAPVTREALVKLVGRDCNFDELISDIREDLRARPYELVQVAGGYQLRTKARYGDAIRFLNKDARDTGPPELTPNESFVVTAIAYLQPATRAELSRLAGREISRDVIGALKRHGLIDGALRAPEPGAPYAYVTTKKFLEVFDLASLRDLPDIEKLEDAGLLMRSCSESDLDGVLGLKDEAAKDDNDAEACNVWNEP